MHITFAELRQLCPHGDPGIMGEIARLAPDMLPRYGIDTNLRWCHFIAQVAAETGGLRSLEENLNYSAKRLTEVWPGRYPTLAAAQPYAHNPEALANHTYGGRNGNREPGDGWKYRGRGLKMLTGRGLYEEAERATGIPLVEHPELAAQFPETLQIACWYWSSRRLNQYADIDDAEMVTRGVNGGLIGFAERLRYLSIMKSIRGTGADHIVDANKMVRPTLRLGDTGPAVVTLQEALARLEPLPSKLVADGHFGPRTEETLRLFQAIHGLDMDGIAGPRTWAAIDAALHAPPGIDEPDPLDEPGTAPHQQPASTAGFFYRLLRLFGLA